MRDAGLRVNYSRVHPGQGTRNLCACLDDIFLELLWLDGSEISAESNEIGLAARGRGNGAPIGISWRGPTTLETKPYHAPFLPKGMSIPIAAASADLSLPFVFQTPGGIPPIDRTDGLVGTRQLPFATTMRHAVIGDIPAPDAQVLLRAFSKLSITSGKPHLQIELLNDQSELVAEIDWLSDL